MSEMSAALAANAWTERAPVRSSIFDRLAAAPIYYIDKLRPSRTSERWSTAMRKRLDDVSVLAAGTLVTTLRDARYRLRKEALSDASLDEALAIVAELAARHDQSRPHLHELAIARALLNRRVVELAQLPTPQAVGIAACVGALAGLRVHVLCANPAHPAADPSWLASLASSIGLTFSCIEGSMNEQQRRDAYACDIVCGNVREIAFDYLRDRVLLKQKPRGVRGGVETLAQDDEPIQPLMRGLGLGILVETETTALDDAYMPLTLSADSGSGQEERLLLEALGLAQALEPSTHFVLHDHSIEITEAGSAELARLTADERSLWSGARRRETLVRLALIALSLQRGHDYQVTNGALEVDDALLTQWESQLEHRFFLRAFLAIKEDCKSANARAPLASLSLQSFLKRYVRLGGLALHARPASAELWSAFGLLIAAPSRAAAAHQQWRQARVFAREEEKWRSLITSVRACAANQVPVIVATRTPASATELSSQLKSAGIAHTLLTGTQDAAELHAFREAAQPGNVTVAVTHAARGAFARGNGGAKRLRVFFAQPLESSRQERHFAARCDITGSSVARCYVSLEDELVAAYAPWVLRVMARISGVGWLRRATVMAAQSKARSAMRRHRALLTRSERELEDALPFA